VGLGCRSTYREPPQPDPTSANETNPLSGVVPYVSGGKRAFVFGGTYVES
jgi:hypothetical protein